MRLIRNFLDFCILTYTQHFANLLPTALKKAESSYVSSGEANKCGKLYRLCAHQESGPDLVW